MITGGEDVELCLRDYPDLAEELRPLLLTARATKTEINSIQPRPDFKALAKQRVLTEVLAKEKKQFKPAGFSLRGWQRRWVVVVTTVLLTVVLAGSGLVAAAGGSMPDDFLYPVKIATERVRVAFTRSDLGKAKLWAEFADRRIKEISIMANEGNDTKVEATADRFLDNLNKVEDLAEAQKEKDVVKEEDVAELRSRMAQYVEEHTAVLEETLEKAPSENKAAINRTIDDSQKSIANTIQNINVAARVKAEVKPVQPVKRETVAGRLKMISAKKWIVGEEVVNIDRNTVIEGVPRVGLGVKVIAMVQPDGSLLARTATIVTSVNNDTTIRPEISPSPIPANIRPKSSPNQIQPNTQKGISPEVAPTDSKISGNNSTDN
ncbi:DUF5667 domain-containing protein [Chloroflexota bacterium]